MPSCSATSRASSQPAPLLERTAPRTSPSSCSTTRRGEWLAWEGSGDFDTRDHGGAINGAVVAAAARVGAEAVHLRAGVREGEPGDGAARHPVHFPTAEAGVLYSPRNYDGRYRGPLLARRALAGSGTCRRWRSRRELGVPDVLRFLRRAGFTTFDDGAYYGLGLTLGNAEVRLDELVAAYAAFARGGCGWHRGWSVSGLRLQSTPGGRPETATADRDWIRSRPARVAAHGVLDHRHPRGRRRARVHLRPRRPARVPVPGRGEDRHVAGVPRQLDGRLHAHVTVGVWVGNFDRTPLRGSSGVTGAGPIFHAVMLAAEARAAGDHQRDGAGAAAPPIWWKRRSAGCRVCARTPPVRSNGASGCLRCAAAAADALPCSWHHASERAGDGVARALPCVGRCRRCALGAGSAELPGSRRSSVVRSDSDARHASTSTDLQSQAGQGTVFLIDPTLRRSSRLSCFEPSAPEVGHCRGRSTDETWDPRPEMRRCTGRSSEVCSMRSCVTREGPDR